MTDLSTRLQTVTAQLIARYGVPAPAPAPTPAPTPTPTPTPTPAPAGGAGLSGLQLVGDDYTGYASVADFLAACSSNIGGTGNWQTALYHDGRGANLVALDTAVRYNGHATLRYDFPVGGGPPELWPSLPTALTHLWLRVKLRFAPGFTTVGTLAAANAYKLLGWALQGVNGSGRLEITNTTQYDLYWGATNSAGATVVPNSDPGGGPQVKTEWSDGLWYDYIIEYQITSPTTAVARFWLAADGQPPVLLMTRTRTAAAGFTMPPAYAVMLGLNFNQNVLKPMAVNWGQWEVVDGTQHPDPFGLGG